MLLRTLSLIVLLAASQAALEASNNGECAYKCNPLDIKEPTDPKAGTNVGKAVMGILFGMTNVMRAKVLDACTCRTS